MQLFPVLVAGAATAAGAIRIDRARGNLIQMWVTDLGDAEIVGGKERRRAPRHPRSAAPAVGAGL